MNAVDASDHFEKSSQEQSPSLLTVILDTNPAAWSLLSPTLSFSSAVANLLVFVNAHLAANYTNRVAVIASHCDKAQWLYPSPTEQKPPRSQPHQPRNKDRDHDLNLEPSKRLRLNLNPPTETSSSPENATSSEGNKYRPFRLIEQELVQNLTTLLNTTTPTSVSSSTSTMIAGALTLALSHTNRESISHAESLIGGSTNASSSNTGGNTGGAAGLEASTDPGSAASSLQSRILLISASPSTDLAHQYIPIMNAIFACQRLSIPIDILQLPLPGTSPNSSSNQKQDRKTTTTSSSSSSSDSTVFLQQAADATHGIFIPVELPTSTSTETSSQTSQSPSSSPSSSASQAFLTYLLSSFLPSPTTRARHLILPTRIDVDFRAACFCHRNVVSVGFVCSICLSIFCSVPENGDCLTCGTHLTVGHYGARPVVVAKKTRRNKTASR